MTYVYVVRILLFVPWCCVRCAAIVSCTMVDYKCACAYKYNVGIVRN